MFCKDCDFKGALGYHAFCYEQVTDLFDKNPSCLWNTPFHYDYVEVKVFGPVIKKFNYDL